MNDLEQVSPEKASMIAMCQNLRELQNVLLDQIMAAGNHVDMDVAETLEDVANAYLDAAEVISARYLSSRPEARPSPSDILPSSPLSK